MNIFNLFGKQFVFKKDDLEFENDLYEERFFSSEMDNCLFSGFSSCKYYDDDEYDDVEFLYTLKGNKYKVFKCDIGIDFVEECLQKDWIEILE